MAGNPMPSLTDITHNFQQLVENSPIAFYFTDTEGRITFFNKAAVKLWGRSPEIGKDQWCGSWKTYSPNRESLPPEESPLAKTLREGRTYDGVEIIIERPDHSFRNILVYPRLFHNKEGRLLGAQNTLVDITQKYDNEMKQAILSAIVESSDDAIISKDLNGHINSWNSGAERIFKYSEEEILGKSITILNPPSKIGDETLILNSIKAGKKIDHFETIRVDKYGKEIPVSLTVSPLKDSRGTVVGASIVGRNISERLHGEERRAVLSAIVESSGDAIISKNLRGIIMSWNKGAEQIFGYSEKEVLGRSVTLLIPEERLQEEDLILGKIRNGERVHHFETWRRHKDGRIIPISLTVSPIRDKESNIIGASKIARDISTQVQSQQQIEKYAKNLEAINTIGKNISKKMDVKSILQNVTDATTKLTGASFGAFFYNSVNTKGDILKLYTLSGISREAFEGFDMPRSTEIFHPTYTGKAVVRADDNTKDPRYGKSSPHYGIPEGHPPVKSFLSIPVISQDNNVIGGLFYGHPEPGVFKEEHEALVLNIAAQAAISLENSKLFEQVKTFSEKKDEFIAVASHELKTPLTTVKGYLQVLTKKDQDTMSTLFLKKSLNQVNKLNTLVDDLLNMSRLEAGKLDFAVEKFDLRQLLLDMVETFTYSHKSHKLIYDLGDAPVYFKGDKQRIEQVINNLLTNAVKYSPMADEVHLKLRVEDKKIRIHVKDKGIGLTPQEQRKIFSRYYRAENTKGISGLGLGLYLTKEIVDRHHGKIEVSSKVGEGSEFICTLPLAHL